MKFIHAFLDAVLPRRPVCIYKEPDPRCIPGGTFRQYAYMARLWRQS
jgi:hypothetical protein